MSDLVEAFDFIDELVKISPSVSSGMTALLDYCEAKNSDFGWSKIKNVDFASDTQSLSNWLEQVLSIEPPSNKIKSFWFGIYNPVTNGKPSCQLYISGSTKKSSEPDWAVWAEDTYLPKHRYADSKVLSNIYSTLVENQALGNWEYILCLGYAGLVVKSIWRAVGLEGFDVAVGFDEGDYIVLNSTKGRKE